MATLKGNTSKHSERSKQRRSTWPQRARAEEHVGPRGGGWLLARARGQGTAWAPCTAPAPQGSPSQAGPSALTSLNVVLRIPECGHSTPFFFSLFVMFILSAEIKRFNLFKEKMKVH